MNAPHPVTAARHFGPGDGAKLAAWALAQANARIQARIAARTQIDTDAMWRQTDE